VVLETMEDMDKESLPKKETLQLIENPAAGIKLVLIYVESFRRM
jgi:hypothetical protein